MNNCFVKNYNIERMKPESADKAQLAHDPRQMPENNALPEIIGTI
jgi:hypothetical protein